MAYTFNPFTGNLDEVGAGGAVTPGGSNTEVQFNDGGSLGGDDGLTFNKTTNELTVGASTGDGGSAKVYGDINLDDGGASTTTIQCVTPTQDRTISFPDATGTVALVAGSNQAVQYNSAGANAGDSGLLYDATSGSLTVGGKTVTTSAPVINLSQTWNSAGTTFTGLKLNVTNTASASGSNLLDLQVGGTSKFNVTQDGKVSIGSSNSGTFFNGGTPLRFGLFMATSVGGAATSQMWQCNSSGSLSFRLDSTLTFGWSSGSPDSAQDLILARDAANTLAQRNSTASQTFRLYNTWANNGVDFERTSITRDSSGLVIDAQKGGTGADPTNLLDLKLSGTSRFSVTNGGQVLVPNGSLTNPSYGFSANTDCGFYIRSTNQIGTVVEGVLKHETTGFGLDFNNFPIRFSSNVTATAPDVGLFRSAAGVIKVTNGSSNNTGTGYIKQVPVNYSALPDPTDATGVGAGTRGFVNDASITTFGDIITSGTGTPSAATTVPVYSDGTNWRIG